MVIILTVPLATFGAMIGLWLYDMPLDLFGQIGLVMLIGLETKNAILIIEFGVELMEKHGMSIIDSAKEASRQRLRPILMTSFAFVFGVLPMARATGAGAYSRNSLGVVIAFGIRDEQRAAAWTGGWLRTSRLLVDPVMDGRLHSFQEFLRGQAGSGFRRPQHGRRLTRAQRIFVAQRRALRLVVLEQIVHVLVELLGIVVHDGLPRSRPARFNARNWSTFTFVSLRFNSCAVSRTEYPRRKRSSSTRR